MNNITISIFGNKIFLEIIKEMKLFSEFNIIYYENLDNCINESKEETHIPIIFINSLNKKLVEKIKVDDRPLILVQEDSFSKNIFNGELNEKIKMPFTILELKKKIVLLIAKSEFKRNSLISLNGYVIDKNERKLKKNDKEIQLSEKEINFLVLFSKNNEPISKDLVLKKVWNYSSESETHTVETHIHRLRKKILKTFGDSGFIKNNNKGYFI